MPYRRPLACLILLLTLCCYLCAVHAAKPQGYYTCRGIEAGGKAYSGVAVITKKSEVYIVQWTLAGGTSFAGVGVRIGDSLSVGWAMETDKGLIRGVNVYQIGVGRNLSGRWAALPGTGIVQSESLKFLRKLEVDE